jgi:hypothetical protein
MENYNRASAAKQTARVEQVIENTLLQSQESRQLQQEIHSQILGEEEEEAVFSEEEEEATFSEEEEESIELEDEDEIEAVCDEEVSIGKQEESEEEILVFPDNSGNILKITIICYSSFGIGKFEKKIGSRVRG